MIIQEVNTALVRPSSWPRVRGISNICVNGHVVVNLYKCKVINKEIIILSTYRRLPDMVTSLIERTAQNARSFKLSDRFERCANSFFANSLIPLHSFSFTQKIKDHSSLLSVRSIYKSDVTSFAFTSTTATYHILRYKYIDEVVKVGKNFYTWRLDYNWYYSLK